jgi:hypothetical protein
LREWIHNKRRLFAMRRANQPTSHFEEYRIGRIVPVGEVADEAQDFLAQLNVSRARRSLKRIQDGSHTQLETFGAAGNSKAINMARQAAAPPTTDAAYWDARAEWIDRHDFCSLAAFRFSDLAPPFLAGAKLASINASRTSIAPQALSLCARAVMILVITPERTHC